MRDRVGISVTKVMLIYILLDFSNTLLAQPPYIPFKHFSSLQGLSQNHLKAPKIRSVKPYVESVLQNLLSNAIKYRHPDRVASIRLSTHPVDDYICLTVTDNGLGIDTALYKEKVFTLYPRFHTHVDGKGLGLYLVKTQILALGAKIELESQVGEGTVFKVYFKSRRPSYA